MGAVRQAQTDCESELREREHELSVLNDCLGDVTERSRGRLVLVRGEAGVGKTALLRHFCDRCPQRVRTLWAGCDALFTPRPLGPLLDVAKATGGKLEEMIRSTAPPHDVLGALIAELESDAPSVLVLEDLHWADEATLDVVRLLSRRSETVPALVLASYREEQVERAPLLRLVLGEIPARGPVVRLALDCLSRQAVLELGDAAGIDADELYEMTAGNPFFVTEALAARTERVPATVREAVLARAARLSEGARALLDAVSITPQPTEPWLLQALADPPADSLAQCLGSGILVGDGEGVAFRHELARLAIEASLAPDRKALLHRRALMALAQPPVGELDLARLAHHAEAAGDGQATLRYAPSAAARASAFGAHRESAAQYARALRFAGGMQPPARATLLANYADECLQIDQTDEAVGAAREAIALRKELGDIHGQARVLQQLSAYLWCPGHTAEARETAREAVTLLEQLEPGQELASAYAYLAQLFAENEDLEEALVWASRALELTGEDEESEPARDAAFAVGKARFLRGKPEGREQLVRVLELERVHGSDKDVALLLDNLVWASVRQRRYADAREYLDPALELAQEHGVDLIARYLLAYRAQMELALGRWDDAVETAVLVLREPRRSIKPRIVAHAVIGVVRARRGDPEVWQPLDRALALSRPSDELQAVEPVAIARAEAAWLESRPELADEITATTLALAISRETPWVIGELASWRSRLGLPNGDLPANVASTPHGLSLAGDWQLAAERWLEIGCPYESALALAEADDGARVREAHEQLQALGAAAAAAIVARRLREMGVRGVRRGPRRKTRENAAGLTAREVEVLALVTEGLRNSQIAERLVVSTKTVDHHVSAILRKLDVATRGEAVAHARRLELLSANEPAR